MTADKQGPAGGAVPGRASPRVRRPLRGVVFVLFALIATAAVAVIVTMFAFVLSFYSWMAGAAVAAGGLVLAIPVWRARKSVCCRRPGRGEHPRGGGAVPRVAVGVCA